CGDEPDLKRRAGLTSSGTEPAAQQIRQLVSPRAGRTRDIARFLRETELPHCSIGKTHVRLSLGQRRCYTRGQLQDRVALVPDDLAHEAVDGWTSLRAALA